jgi:hypothetical protein
VLGSATLWAGDGQTALEGGCVGGADAAFLHAACTASACCHVSAVAVVIASSNHKAAHFNAEQHFLHFAQRVLCLSVTLEVFEQHQLVWQTRFKDSCVSCSVLWRERLTLQPWCTNTVFNCRDYEVSAQTICSWPGRTSCADRVTDNAS